MVVDLENYVYSYITFEYLNNIRGKARETFKLQYGMTRKGIDSFSVVDWIKFYVLDDSGKPMILFIRSSDLAYMTLS